MLSNNLYSIYTHMPKHTYVYKFIHTLNFQTYLWPRYVTRVRSRKLNLLN